MINALDYVEFLTENLEPALDYTEYILEHSNKNIAYAEYVAQSIGNYPNGSAGISGTCGLSGVSGISGTCGESSSSGFLGYSRVNGEPMYYSQISDSKLPILKDLELIPINKPIKIQNSGLYGSIDSMLYE
jgi:hypothetical protein